MTRAIFLSASVPDLQRDPRYHTTADRVAIRDAVRALVTVALPHMRLVWGGHPAITPLVRVIAEGIGIVGADKVRLYQSNFFRGLMPKDNIAFEKLIRTPAVKGDQDASLERMRRQMLSSEKFYAGVFIGGMEGVEKEYAIFREMHTAALALPIASTGAAALIIYKNAGPQFPTDLETDLAYPSLFRRLLRIPLS
jgi:hypothetical protein